MEIHQRPFWPQFDLNQVMIIKSSQMLKRHGSRVLYLFHREARGNVVQVNTIDQSFVKVIETLHVSDHNLEQIIVLTAHSVKLNDFLKRGRMSGKFIQPLPIMPASFYLYKDGH